MIIGVPKEIKDYEFRVGMVPSSVKELVSRDHKVYVQSKAGIGIGFHDEDYVKAGATVLATAEEIFEKSELIVKVKEPQPNECKMLKPNHTLFTYLHLAPDPRQAELLIDSGCAAIAYETVTADDGGLPLLTPSSEVAGRLSIQAGAHCLEKTNGGSGVLLGGVAGVSPANVVVIGGGVVGTNALTIAIGMQANVTVFDRSIKRLRELNNHFGASLNTLFASQDAIEKAILDADLVIGAVLIPGASAPKVVQAKHLKQMRPGSVLVDVSIDQGGCFETSKVTTHSNPTYIVDNIVHYCVGNMPGAVPRTSTFALNNVTLPFIITLANKGVHRACREDRHLLNGLNVYDGKITHQAVAEALNMPLHPPERISGLNE